MRISKLIVCFLLIISNTVFAFSFKKYAGEFLSLGAGSRSLGMAGAFTAVANDVTSGYWNPAGLIDAKGMQVQFMHSKQFISSIQYNYLSASRVMDENSTIGVSLLYLTVNDIKDSRNALNIADDKIDYSKVNLFNTGDYSAIISYARRYSDDLRYGVNVKMIYRDYEISSAMGIGFDAGLKYYMTEKLQLGLMIRDITTTMIAWKTGEKELIAPSIRLGATYPIEFSDWNLRIQPAVDFNFLFEGREYASQLNIGPLSADIFSGIEVAYDEIIAIRAGMDDLNRFNTGIGLQIPYIMFDYAFTSYQNELGDIHRISFHLKFEDLF